MSSTLSVSSTPCQRPSRSRSSSVTESTPDSTSSDSHSSSDPDTHLSSLSPWLQTPSTTGAKDSLGTHIDGMSNPHVLDMDSEMSFDGGIHDLQALSAVHGSNFNFDDLVYSHTSSNNKSDMLMLEEIIKDGAFDPASSPSEPPLSLYPAYPAALRDIFNPPLPPQPQEPMPRLHPHSICINPSSTQAGPQLSSPNREQPSNSVSLPSTLKAEPSGVVSSPKEQNAEVPNSEREHSTTFQSLIPHDITYSAVSSHVVHPPKDACLDLPIFFPSIPLEGTKSRVETQIKLTFELGISALHPSSPPFPNSSVRQSSVSSSRLSSSSSSGSNSLSASPELSASRELPPAESCNTSQRPTHDKVGTYKFLRLPHGTATKRRPASSANAKREVKACDVDLQETLQMTADVVCCSPPHALVQSCPSCQSREAKRTARKLAARVRPPPSARTKPKAKATGKKAAKKVKDQVAEVADLEEEDEDEEEPNVDGSILQFNCTEIMDFSGGSIVLPMRITCYCRHHKEKVGFSIVFTLIDHTGRVVGRGTTPPILITDDHKSTNAVSKLPPMHPLRQAFNTPTPPLLAQSPANAYDDYQPSSSYERAGRAPTKRRDPDLAIRKPRPKPYDGRPVHRPGGVGPGIEGRQGVVLALHPAHARIQTSTQTAIPSGSSSTDTSSRISSSPVTRSPTPSYPEAHTSTLHSPDGLFTSQGDLPMSSLSSDAAMSHPPSPRNARQSTINSSPLSLSSSPRVPNHLTPPHPRAHPDLQSYPPAQQAVFDPSSFPMYPSLPLAPEPHSLPKIHRLIPSSGPTTGGIEITVLGSNFYPSFPLECVFGGAVASSTHRWSDNTLVCVLPPRATPGVVHVDFVNIKLEGEQDESGACLFNYVDESDRQLMELALQVVGLKMTGKIEEARNVAMRIVGNTNSQTPTMTVGELTQMNTLSETSFVHHSFLGSLSGVDLETLIIKLLTLLDVPSEDGLNVHHSALRAIEHRNATGQTLLHLAVLLALPSLVSCLLGRAIDVDACNNDGMTALHFAAMIGWKEGVEILLAEGAEVSVVDSMGLTPMQRAKRGRSDDDLKTLLESRVPEGLPDGGSGDEGDDEAWRTDSEGSDGETSAEPSSPWPAPPHYMSRSRKVASIHPHSSPDSLPEPEETQAETTAQLSATRSEFLPSAHEDCTKEKPPLDEKHDPSFVERLQRTIPQSILPHVQIPGFPQIQLPGVLAAPWGALPQIPVFPILVPIPNLPHLPNWPAFPWPDALGGERKESRTEGDGGGDKQQQHPPLAMLWTAYDSLANSAWRAQWEKWTAQMTALQHTNNRGSELPPYSPRSEEKEPKLETQNPIPVQDRPSPPITDVITTEDIAQASTSRFVPRASRRVSYNAVNVPETEVDSYHYRPKKQPNKQDRMLVLFWIPILFLGLAYAVYTTLPVAVAGISRATKRMLPQPLQRDSIRV